MDSNNRRFKATAESNETRPKPELLTQEEIDERLLHKRKIRGHKACHPCRQRKVGCNYAQPCQRCIDRNHPELCQYEPMLKRANTRTPGGNNPQTNASNEGPSTSWNKVCEKLHMIKQSVQELRTELKEMARRDRIGRDSSSNAGDQDNFAINASNEVTGGTVYLGGNSVPAMVIALKSDPNEYDVQDLLGKNILPLFSLDNESATYPFVNL